MTSVQCKGKTISGKPCKRKAGISGYCYQHDPSQKSENETYKKSSEKEPEFAIPTLSFSERHGFKLVSKTIQIDSMSQELKNSLWNVLESSCLDINLQKAVYYGSRETEVYISLKFLWMEYFKEPLNKLNTFSAQFAIQQLWEYYENLQWREVYEFFELTLNYFKNRDIVEKVNFVLERELSGYRFVGGVFTSITSKQEIELLTEEIENNDFPAVSSHLKRALTLMSDRENPDYRNSIKESISAVESLAKNITGQPKATLGDALKRLTSAKKIHPALQKSFLMLYGYTSDEGGIRHAMLEEPDLNAHDAKFFLLSCTSFINYLKSQI
jgi:hypothetical protein